MKRQKNSPTWDIRIQGRVINIHLARIVYKCSECLGEVDIHNKGLLCKASQDHRGFIHRDEVKAIKEKQDQNISELSDFYVIKDGKVMVK